MIMNPSFSIAALLKGGLLLLILTPALAGDHGAVPRIILAQSDTSRCLGVCRDEYERCNEDANKCSKNCQSEWESAMEQPTQQMNQIMQGLMPGSKSDVNALMAEQQYLLQQAGALKRELERCRSACADYIKDCRSEGERCADACRR